MRISNKLRALLIVVVSIVAIAVALPVMSEMVHAEDCTITFHENKGTDPETDPELTYPQTVTVGTSTVLDQNTFDREDYVFVGIQRLMVQELIMPMELLIQLIHQHQSIFTLSGHLR